jgi:hypothetical protein
MKILKYVFYRTYQEMRFNSKMQLPSPARILRLTCYTKRGSILDAEKDMCYTAACSHTVGLILTCLQYYFRIP